MFEQIDIPEALAPVVAEVAEGLTAVGERFDEQLSTDLPPLAALVGHIERYRGKMLRPTLVLSAGLAAAGEQGGGLTSAHARLGAVVEMVHMATLVHDDVLDEADVRRRGQTVNAMTDNETAVILGDYLIAAAYHLCSKIDREDPGIGASVVVGDASMRLCAGELLQLHHRGDWSLDDATYREIVLRKTGSLLGVAAALGAAASGADAATRAALSRFGELAGVAFQVQDDLLDLTGDEAVVGKSVRRDLAKGKVTLPLIHGLATAEPTRRGAMLRRIEAIAGDAADADAEAAGLVRTLAELGSIDHARASADALIAEAKSELGALPATPARDLLALAADAAINRKF